MAKPKQFSWEDLLSVHPLLINIDLDDRRDLIGELLYDEVAKEEFFEKGRIIIREGEFGECVYMVGTGSVRVVMLGDDGEEVVTLFTFRRGDTFGEMALFDNKIRSATVIANTDTTVLKFHGDRFLEIIRRYPILEFNIITRLSERLRHTDKQILANQKKNIDEKLDHFNTKLNAELKVIDASLKASQTVFEQTKLRTDEVINSAERSRSRLTFAASAVGIIISLFGFFGFKEFLNVKELSTTVEKKIERIQEKSNEIERLQQDIKKMTAEAAKLESSVLKTNTFIFEQVILVQFRDGVQQSDPGKANAAYDLLSNLGLDDPLLHRKRKILLGWVWFEMIDVLGDGSAPSIGTAPKDFKPYLDIFIDDDVSPELSLMSQFLVVINAAVKGPEEFNGSIRKFEEFLSRYDGPGLTGEEIENTNEIFERRTERENAFFEALKEITPKEF